MSKRKSFTEVGAALPMPDLIEIQKDSYNWFIKEGLEELFDEINPVVDFIGRDLELYFEDHYLDEPKFSEIESREKNITYEAPLRVKTRLLNKKTKESITQEVFLGDFPLMTGQGTFIVNGIERAARDSGHVVIADEDGVISKLDGGLIELTTKKGQVITYNLNKFLRSNSSTCINQHPVIELDEKVKKGQILSDGPAIDKGELSLGKNVLAAFTTKSTWTHRTKPTLMLKLS